MPLQCPRWPEIDGQRVQHLGVIQPQHGALVADLRCDPPAAIELPPHQVLGRHPCSVKNTSLKSTIAVGYRSERPVNHTRIFLVQNQ